MTGSFLIWPVRIFPIVMLLWFRETENNSFVVVKNITMC